MEQKTKVDLGSGSVGKLLFKLALPAITAQIINALYNIVDRIYIGRIPEIGSFALTGVGVTFPIIMLISAFSALIGMGGAPIAAIRMGQGDHKAAEKIMGNCLSMLLIFSVILTTVFLVFRDPLLLAFGASEATLPYAANYMTIYLAGTIFVQLSLGLNSFINTQGFAKTGMLTVLIGAVTNIVLDPIFIFVFNMGVQGAALATILSQALSAVWVLLFLFGKKTSLRFRKENFRPSFKVIGPVLALGVSPFVMQATESLVNITFNSSLKYYSGDLAVGAMTILGSLMQMLMMPMMGLAQGAQPIISYNYGAQKHDRVKKAFRLLLISAFAFTTIAWAAMMLFPALFASFFTPDPALIEVAASSLRIYMAGIFMFGIQNACQQTFLAVGQAKISLFLALLRKIILLIPLALILPRFIGANGIFLAEPIADVLAALTTLTMFLIYSKKIFTGAPIQNSAPVEPQQ